MAGTIFFTMAYNAQQTIRRTIESILNQSLGDFDYYILNNGSTDNTRDIIGEYASRDKRVKRIHINVNDIRNSQPIWNTLVHASDAKYIAWCDADDEYTPDFLENMVSFSEENQLDIAACGYEKIDGKTEQVIKHRALDENLVLYGDEFTEKFIKYRGFTPYFWGKLYSIPFLRSLSALSLEKDMGDLDLEYHVCRDSIRALAWFLEAERAGIYGKAMVKYYQYPRSLKSQNLEVNISSYIKLWHKTKEYLAHYGPISKINEDFLYAIYLSIVEETANSVFSSELTKDIKLKLLAQIFEDPVWAETLAREADLQFHNLAARDEYVKDIERRINELQESTL